MAIGVTKKFAIGLHETEFGWYATCTHLDGDPIMPSPSVKRGYTSSPQELMRHILPGVIFRYLLGAFQEDDSVGMEMVRMHAEAEEYAEQHPTPTVKEELEWASTELMVGNLEKSLWEGEVQVFDSCTVEVDGVCPHGYKSPLILMGLI